METAVRFLQVCANGMRGRLTWGADVGSPCALLSSHSFPRSFVKTPPTWGVCLFHIFRSHFLQTVQERMQCQAV